MQRRIIYAMSELGLDAAAKHKKSARTVGDVIGKYHPHGDAACYETMVGLSQDFNSRYPLLDGQGNWGSLDDPKSFAAMRYTEVRLRPYARSLLSELGLGTVDWQDNFDGTLREPLLLPARLPNILLNGATGIAVGMSTELPPHNLREVIAACIHLLRNPRATLPELLRLLPAPDFSVPVEIISPAAELEELYARGNGTVRVRAPYLVENGLPVITGLPAQVSVVRVREQIISQLRANKLPMLEDLRNESDERNPVRLVLVPRSRNCDVKALMSHLFATTDLERKLRVHMNVIGLNGKPRVMDLRSLLLDWLRFRTETIIRRLRDRLRRLEQRLEELEGLLKAYGRLEEVIRVIREEEAPREKLMQLLELSELQAEAILELRLRRLARLEENKLRRTAEAMTLEQKELLRVLASPRHRLKTLLQKELLRDEELHGDERRCPLRTREPAQAMAANVLLTEQPITVVLSREGWIRAARGHEINPSELAFRGGDALLQAVRGRSRQSLSLLGSSGRCYNLEAHNLPSARSLGEPVSTRIQPPDGERCVGLMLGDPDELFLLAGNAGYGFLARLEDLRSHKRAGKTVLKPTAGRELLAPLRVPDPEQGQLAALSAESRLLVLPLRELSRRAAGRGACILRILGKRYKTGADHLQQLLLLGARTPLLIKSGRRHLRVRVADRALYAGAPGTRGTLLPRGFRKNPTLHVEHLS